MTLVFLLLRVVDAGLALIGLLLVVLVVVLVVVEDASIVSSSNSFILTHSVTAFTLLALSYLVNWMIGLTIGYTVKKR